MIFLSLISVMDDPYLVFCAWLRAIICISIYQEDE